MTEENAFEMAASAIRFGSGCTREVGAELADQGERRVMVLTDPSLRALPPVAAVLDSLEEHGIGYTLYDRVRVEPSEESFQDAIRAVQAEDFEAFVAVGGGSTIDTAKAANLRRSWPGSLKTQ